MEMVVQVVSGSWFHEFTRDDPDDAAPAGVHVLFTNVDIEVGAWAHDDLPADMSWIRTIRMI